MSEMRADIRDEDMTKNDKKRTDLEWFENWMDDAVHIRDKEGETVIDLVFEFLVDKCMLTPKGKKLAYAFWKKYVRRRSNP